MKCTAARNETSPYLRLAENRAFTTGKSYVARQGEFTSASAHSASYEGDAHNAALSESCRSIDPWRNAEAATRLCRAVVSDKKIRVGALVKVDTHEIC